VRFETLSPLVAYRLQRTFPLTNPQHVCMIRCKSQRAREQRLARRRADASRPADNSEHGPRLPRDGAGKRSQGTSRRGHRPAPAHKEVDAARLRRRKSCRATRSARAGVRCATQCVSKRCEKFVRCLRRLYLMTRHAS